MGSSPAVRASMVGLVLRLVLLGAALALPGRAHAADPPRADRAQLEAAARSEDPVVAATALFHLAEVEDESAEYAAALAHYRAAVARLPSFRWAARAMTRASVLEAHSEGEFRPFARLEEVRRDPARSDDPAAIAALARDADGFPPGATRVEAWMVCAEAWLRMHRRAEGEVALRKVVDAKEGDALIRRQAASELVNALADDGDLAGARSTARALGAALDPRVAARVEVLARRRWLHDASTADLVAVAALAVVAVARAWRRGEGSAIGQALRRGAPLGLGFAAYVALAGAGLASVYEQGNAAPFVGFSVALVPLVIAARAWSAAGSRATAARALRTVACVSAVASAAFLVLEAVNGQYLEGFGL